MRHACCRARMILTSFHSADPSASAGGTLWKTLVSQTPSCCLITALHADMLTCRPALVSLSSEACGMPPLLFKLLSTACMRHACCRVRMILTSFHSADPSAPARSTLWKTLVSQTPSCCLITALHADMLTCRPALVSLSSEACGMPPLLFKL